MTNTADQPTRATGEAAKRTKREVLGIADRKKHHGRALTALKSRPKEPGTRQRVYRYRSYPTRSQAEQLEQTFGACRWVYNEGLALRAGAWEQHRVTKGPSLDVSVREWTCAECGTAHDRDVNAARNLREAGMRLYWEFM